MGVRISDNFGEWGTPNLDPHDPGPLPEDDDGTHTPQAAELTDFLNTAEEAYDWLVSELIERGDRTFLTGIEGCGKSTLLRQVGVQLAAGIHPFTLEPTTPLRVLLLDLENGVRHVRRKLRTLRIQAGDDYAPLPGLHIHVRPQGLDLLVPGEGQWLLDLAKTAQPDVFILGPVYKLAGGDPRDELPARVVASWLDRIRYETRCALILEGHSPYAPGGQKRPTRPYGASLWSRWPEFGLNLSEQGYLTHWRQARDERAWPALLQRGGAWPWTVSTRPRDERWARIVDLCTAAGDQLSYRDLAELCGVNASTIQHTVKEHQDAWNALAAPKEGGTP